MTINLNMPGGRYYFVPAKETSEEIMSEVARATEAAITEVNEEDAFAHVDNTPAPAPAPKKQIPKAAKIMKQAPVPDPAPEAEAEQTDITLDVVLSNLKADSDNLASDYADLIRIIGSSSGDSERVKKLEEENKALKEKCAKLQKMVIAATE
jgi:hypothetical protein